MQRGLFVLQRPLTCDATPDASHCITGCITGCIAHRVAVHRFMV
jgi:hypothetical protein